jgi:epoxide hydrolase 4
VAQLEHRVVEANGLALAVTTAGNPSAPPLLFLHGFPEHRGAWDDVLPHFADRFFVIAPDQRGYGASSKPDGVEAYRAPKLAEDMRALMDVLAPGKAYGLVGHDWGASVAYMLAFAARERVARLAIINGVHPILFQRALLDDAEQTAASQYIHFLRAATAEEKLREDDYRRLEGFLTKFGNSEWLTPEKRAAYRKAWTTPGALTGMLNWYRASPLLIPKTGEPADRSQMPQVDFARFKVTMPHLLIWGMDDPALRPITRRGLETFARDLEVVEIAGADHWVIHQKPDQVIPPLQRFFAPLAA